MLYQFPSPSHEPPPYHSRNSLDIPARQRSNTIPRGQSIVLPSSTDRRPSVTSHPVRWKRVGSLNTLAERHYDISSLLENFHHHDHHNQAYGSRSYEFLSSGSQHVATQTDPLDIIPQDFASCPLKISSDSTVDDGDISSLCGSLSPLPLPFVSVTCSQHDQQEWSQPSYTLNSAAEETSLSESSRPLSTNSLENQAHSGQRRSQYRYVPSSSSSYCDAQFTPTESSLMAEIITELAGGRREERGLAEAGGYTSYEDNDITDLDSIRSTLPSLAGSRASLSKLEWIHESLDEEDDSYGQWPPSLFTRDSNLRRSKSSMELSMYSHRYNNKHLSPLTTRIREPFPPLSSSPIQEAEEELTSPPSSPSKTQASLRKLRKKLNFKYDKVQPRTDERKEKQEKPRKTPKGRVKSAGPSHPSRGRWGLFNVIRNRWMSTESGLNKQQQAKEQREEEVEQQDEELGCKKEELIVQHVTLKGSPRTMKVLRSPHHHHHHWSQSFHNSTLIPVHQ